MSALNPIFRRWWRATRSGRVMLLLMKAWGQGSDSSPYWYLRAWPSTVGGQEPKMSWFWLSKHRSGRWLPGVVWGQAMEGVPAPYGPDGRRHALSQVNPKSSLLVSEFHLFAKSRLLLQYNLFPPLFFSKKHAASCLNINNFTALTVFKKHRQFAVSVFLWKKKVWIVVLHVCEKWVYFLFLQEHRSLSPPSSPPPLALSPSLVRL